MFSRSLIVAAVSVPFIASTVYAADCTRTYTVVDGDICDSISAANNASTYQLAAVNSGVIDSTCSNLSPDSSICLGTEGEDCSTTYVVQSGDTCDDISSVFGINSTLLWTNNPNIDDECSNIYIGEVLCVADSVLVPPIPSSGIPATSIPATATAAVPTETASTINAAAATPTDDDGDDGEDDGDDEDDDDLPYCDEL
ncbi:carbohydrate-binding module family 50 [Pyrrhoderma noxium]|uniref:Carbohydrate-binding module family 50 n=1 Tax=Pyrrhoderma noxium TaxID=2282107 RepID=A0A286UDQ3_9AGAM|nr:carbohydrate-binding module family 50 [Pyrrhoderma noxium]